MFFEIQEGPHFGTRTARVRKVNINIMVTADKVTPIPSKEDNSEKPITHPIDYPGGDVNQVQSRSLHHFFQRV